MLPRKPSRDRGVPKRGYHAGHRSPFHSSASTASNPPTAGSYQYGAGGRTSDAPIRYVAQGGGEVFIPLPIDPWRTLGLPSNASRDAVKVAFKNKINQPNRQSRAVVSIANHILTSTADRYEQQMGTNKFSIKKRDHFVMAACGYTKRLAELIAQTKHLKLLEDADEHGRTLLYIACKSGFYDMCQMLLQKGSPVNQVQRDGSTPLHGAAYYNHTLVVGLLLEYGAKIDIKNRWGHTALQETGSTEIQSLIQTASSDRILSLEAMLKEKRLVASVRPIEFNGKVIAKELLRDPRTLDRRTREKWNTILRTWKLTWHGTKYSNLPSIIKKGLIPSGTDGIKPPAGHFKLGQEYQGLRNWAAAIFLSPSLFYSAHEAYSERVLSKREQWCVLVKVYCNPGCYTSHDPTVFEYTPMEGEPPAPEYRVPVVGEDKNVILRVESARNVVVRSLVFVRTKVLDNQEINFEQAGELFKD